MAVGLFVEIDGLDWQTARQSLVLHCFGIQAKRFNAHSSGTV
jgi:hypothetical protein